MLRALLLLGLIVAPLPARADQAAALAEQGARLFSQAHFKASLKALQRGRALARDPATLGRVHLYIGLNHAALGEEQAARRSFVTALAHDPLLRLEAGRFRPDLIALLEEVRGGLRGELVVTAEDPRQRVIVDGGAPRPPGRQRLPIGAHQVEVRAPDGRTALAKQVIIRVGEAVLLTARRLPPVHRPAGVVAPRPDALLEMPKAPERPRRRVWTWVVAGTALATTAAAVTTGVVADRKFKANVGDPGTDQGCFADSGGDCETQLRIVERLDLTSYVLYGVAGALAVTSAVLFFVEGRRPRRAQASVRLLPSLGGGAVVGSF